MIIVRAITPEGDIDGGGPVAVGRRTERVRGGVVEASRTVQEMLAPVTAMSRAVLDQFRGSGPDSVEVAFGVELSVEAGAVLASASGSCHLQVTLTWTGQENRP